MSVKFPRQSLSINEAYIELIEPEHMDKFYELFELNRDYLSENIPGIDLIKTREDLQQRWATPKENSMPFGIWLNENQLIGRCRLTRFENSSTADIGYW